MKKIILFASLYLGVISSVFAAVELAALDGLEIWQGIAVAVDAAHCFVCQHIEPEAGVVEAPAAVEQRAGGDA